MYIVASSSEKTLQRHGERLLMRSGAGKALQLLLNFGSPGSPLLIHADLRPFELLFSAASVIPERHSTADKCDTASQRWAPALRTKLAPFDCGVLNPRWVDLNAKAQPREKWARNIVRLYEACMTAAVTVDPDAMRAQP
jgi:hypothetical protein